MLSSDVPAVPPYRSLGNSDLMVRPVGFGCWPISGVSTLGVTDQQSIATIHAALDAGINFVDTAFAYGYDGESDKLLAQVLRDRRDEVVLATKVGLHFNSARERVIDGTPDTIIAHTQESLERLGVEQVDIIYLHLPDPNVDLCESAGAIGEVLNRGWAKHAGISNVDASQLAVFHAQCPVVVVQPPFNMLQQQAVRGIREFCKAHNIAIACYWVLMKGLLAGKLSRDHQFDPNDKRLTYAVFQGDAWQRSQNLLDKLRELANQVETSVSQLVIAWTLRQAGVTVALCGAKRPEQIAESAAAMDVQLDNHLVSQIDDWIEDLA